MPSLCAKERMDNPVAAIKDILPGTMVSVEASGEDVLLVNLGGTYYAIGNVCTHMGCNLSDGTLKEETVTCPCHSATFDVRTGALLHGSASEPEPVFKVTVDNGQIFISR